MTSCSFRPLAAKAVWQHRRRKVDYQSNPDWIYSGDVNAEYGGIWIKHHGDYCEAIRITDLSDCGFEGAVAIERVSSGLYARSFIENRHRIRRALECCGLGIGDLALMPRRAARFAIWEAMIYYGYADCDWIETLQLDASQPLRHNCAVAHRYQTEGDIGGYVMAKYLD